MKTKKEIIEWWESRGDNLTDYNDKKDLFDKLDKTISTETKHNVRSDNYYLIELKKKGWKISIELIFYKPTNECVKIMF